MLLPLVRLSRQIEPMINYDYLGKSASANDQTGLIPSGPQNDDEIKSYQDVFPFAPPLLKKDKDSLS